MNRSLRAPATSAGVVVGAIAMSQVLVLADEGEILPWAVVAKALISASSPALLAIALVLLYRSSRIVNFAQASFGTVAAMLHLLLTTSWGWSWWVSAPLSIAVAIGIAVIVELFVMRRFADAPRLVLTVVTIALSQLLAGVALLLPKIWGYVDKPGFTDDDPLPAVSPNTPFDGWVRSWSPEFFRGDELVLLVAAVLAMVALTLFLRRSRTGVAIRAASENGYRAGQLGINTGKLSTVVWVIAGGLGGLAAVLDVGAKGTALQPLVAGATGFGLGAALLLKSLAAAVIGRMEDLPTTVAAALGITIFERAVFWATGRTNYVDVAILLLVVGALLVHRRRLSRTGEDVTGAWAASEELKSIPPELRDLPNVQLRVRQFAYVLGAVVLGYPWVMSPGQVNLGGLYSIYGIIGVSLVVLTGWGGQISLGQFAFVAVGAMLGGTMTATWHWPFFLALVIASTVGAGVAVLVGLPALRIRGLYLAVTTLAFAVATTTMLLNGSTFEKYRPDTISRPQLLFVDTEDERAYYYLCLAGLVFALFVAQGLRRSRTGRVLIAMRDNERAAQSFGISLTRTRLATFAVSGFLASFAGVLYAHHQHGVLQSSFLPGQSLQMFLMAVIGGLGSVYGVLTGAIYLATMSLLVNGEAGQLLGGSAGVLLVLLFFPGGLGALAYTARDVWLRRVALRLKIHVPSLMGERLQAGDVQLVPIAAKPADTGAVEKKYRVDSLIGTTGSSQQARHLEEVGRA